MPVRKVKYNRKRANTRLLTLHGGTILGYGKRSTLVYTIDDLLKHLPRVLRICIVSFTSSPKAKGRRDPPRCLSGGAISIDSKLSQDQGLQNVAIKDCGESAKAMSAVVGEVAWNQKVHKWFEQANALGLTSLHPATSHLEIIHRRAPAQSSFRTTNRVITVSQDGTTIINNKSSDETSNPVSAMIQKRVLPVYRECDGSLFDLNIMHRLTEPELMLMCRRVLQFLQVLHAKQHIHMDVKPDNILFVYDDTTRAYDFCLSDYETLEAANQIASRIRRKGRFPQGTDTYMSPMLTADDTENKVYHNFIAVAKVCLDTDLSNTEFEAIVHAAKKNIDRNIYKVDLHSLALSLLDLILPAPLSANTNSPIEHARILRNALKKFPKTKKLLPRLMFFNARTDFYDAESALAALVEMSSR